jgi:hypothetical protein
MDHFGGLLADLHLVSNSPQRPLRGGPGPRRLPLHAGPGGPGAATDRSRPPRRRLLPAPPPGDAHLLQPGRRLLRPALHAGRVGADGHLSAVPGSPPARRHHDAALHRLGRDGTGHQRPGALPGRRRAAAGVRDPGWRPLRRRSARRAALQRRRRGRLHPGPLHARRQRPWALGPGVRRAPGGHRRQPGALRGRGRGGEPLRRGGRAVPLRPDRADDRRHAGRGRLPPAGRGGARLRRRRGGGLRRHPLHARRRCAVHALAAVPGAAHPGHQRHPPLPLRRRARQRGSGVRGALPGGRRAAGHHRDARARALRRRGERAPRLPRRRGGLRPHPLHPPRTCSATSSRRSRPATRSTPGRR